jgi:biopolymer transport protein ExbD
VSHAKTADRFDQEASSVNISPLIDMVFILLIFFIVTTVFVDESGFQVAASGGESGDAPIVFTITASNQTLHNGVAMGTGSIAAIVRSTASSGDANVLINVEEGARSDAVVNVIDEARGAGAASVNLSTAP